MNVETEMEFRDIMTQLVTVSNSITKLDRSSTIFPRSDFGSYNERKRWSSSCYSDGRFGPPPPSRTVLGIPKEAEFMNDEMMNFVDCCIFSTGSMDLYNILNSQKLNEGF